MWDRIKRLVGPTVVEDREGRLQQITLYTILGVIMLADGALIITHAISSWGGESFVILTIIFAIMTVMLALTHKGQLRVPSIALPIITFSAAGYLAAVNWGIFDESMWAMPLTIALAGLVLGRRGAAIFTGLAVLTTTIIGIGNLAGALPSSLSDYVSGESIVIIDVFMVAVGGLIYVTIGNLAANVERARAAATEIQNRSRELEASQRVTFAASEHIDPGDFLDLVVNLIRDQFGLYHAQVYLTDEERQHAVLQQSTGYAGRVLLQRDHKIPLDATALVTKAIATGEPVLVADVAEEENHMPNPLLPETRSELVVPLKRDGQVIGVLDAQDSVPGRFGASTVALFQTMADQITILFENSELMEEITEQTAALTFFTGQLRTAADIARRLSQIRDSELLLQEVVELIQSRFGLYHAHIYLLDEDEQMLKLRIGAGEVGRVLRARGHAIPLNAERSLVARAARDQGTVRVDDTLQEPGFLPNPLLPQTRSELAIPLVVGDRLLGVLDMQHQEPGHFSETNKDTFNTLAGQIAVALENAELFEQQQEAQHALEESEQQFRSIVEYSHAGVLITDGEYRLTYANEKLAEISGYSVDELVGMDFRQLLTQESRAVVTDYYARRRKGEDVPDRYEFSFTRKDGEERYGQMSVALVIDELGEPQTIAQVLDVTERVAADKERARFTLQLRTAAEIAGEVSSILDPAQLLNAVITQLKEQFDLYHAHFYSYNEARGLLELRAGYGEAGAQMLAQGHAISADHQASLVARAGSTREVVVADDVTQDAGFLANPLLPQTRSEVAVPVIATGKLLGVLDVQHDQTGYFTEGDINVLATLAGQVATALENATLFEEIQQTAERLREVDQLKSEFLANMSHELRTPLNSIIGYAEIMLMGIDGDVQPEILDDIQAIFDNGQHLLRLINDVLDLAKIEAGHMTLHKVALDLTNLLEEVKTSSAGLLVNRPLEIYVESEQELPQVEADPVRLSQIVNNLLSNAVKFTEEGHVKLRAFRDDGHVCVAVEDTGIGISEEDLDLIFERFRQADGSTSRAKEGTGLGLAITKHLVEMHGGTMHVESKLGEGSAFTVRLPALPGSSVS